MLWRVPLYVVQPDEASAAAIPSPSPWGNGWGWEWLVRCPYSYYTVLSDLPFGDVDYNYRGRRR